jgi:N-acetylglucosaminyldiphosphoundecaprenol N-acetyl-beta-D-mannosaminyltransferase
MLHVLEMAARESIPVGFYGGKRDVLDSLIKRMQSLYPSLRVNYAFHPPFRELSEAETNDVQAQITRSGARILFVGLGCPRQEKWIDSQRGFIPAVMIGIGAAFDFHAGQKPQAPAWLQNAGLEWFFRLLSEPRRLWRRYLSVVPRFLLYAVVDLLGLMKKVN